jgi:hypothetical protein
MPLQYFTIVTYGRSGSTALQAAANALPHVLVRGENYAALRGVRGYLQSVAATADRHHAGRPDHPWFGSARLEPRTIRDHMRDHLTANVLRPRKGTRVLGFKEIRYTSAHWPDYDTMLEFLLFLQTLFPGLTYVLNTRSPADTQRSAWWRTEPTAPELLAESERWLTEANADLAAILGEHRSRHIRYEEWREQPELVTEAFRAVGLPVDPSIVTETLATHLGHGSG